LDLILSLKFKKNDKRCKGNTTKKWTTEKKERKEKKEK